MHVQGPGSQPQADDRLPPPVQHDSGALLPAAEVTLRARCSGAAWLEHLPWVLLGLHAAPKEGAGVSAAEATYGHSLVLPSQLQPPPRALQASPTKVVIPSTVKHAKEAEKARQVGVQEAFHVYMLEGAVFSPLDATYQGPYRMLIREKKKLMLEVGAARTWVSADRLKPHAGVGTPAVAQPPPHGRTRPDEIFCTVVLSSPRVKTRREGEV